MENTILIYLFKASIALALFYVIYVAFLKKDTFLTLRRFYFLSAILFSLAYPAINIELAIPQSTQIPAYWLSDIVLVANEPIEGSKVTFDIHAIMLGFSLIVTLCLLVKFIFQITSIVKLKNRSTSIQMNSYCLIKLVDKDALPFSFFRWIFINSDIEEQKLNEVIVHERIHVSQYHSVDVLLAEILCTVFWWNPIVWLLKKEIKVNLEYLADRGVVEEGFDIKTYQYLLLQVSNRNTGISIINNFNVSQLKKRIIMMNKEKTSILKSAKYLLIIPLGITLLFGNAVQATPELIVEPLENVFNLRQSDPGPVMNLVSQNQKKNTEKHQKKNGIYITVDDMPRYPGGEQAMFNFIKANLRYPDSAINAEIEGRVTIRYVVKSTGEVADVTLVRGFDEACDAEAVRMVSSMPNWVPGKMNGTPVDVYYTLPIVFKLNKTEIVKGKAVK